MILLGFLPPTPVIMKLFNKRAAAPIIKIISLFLQWQHLRERKKPHPMLKGRVQIPGWFRSLILIRGKRQLCSLVPGTWDVEQSRMSATCLCLEALRNLILRDVALPEWYRRGMWGGVVWTSSMEWGGGGPRTLKLACQRSVLHTRYEKHLHILLYGGHKMTSGSRATMLHALLKSKCQLLWEETSFPFYQFVQKVLAPFQTQGSSTENKTATPRSQGEGISVDWAAVLCSPSSSSAAWPSCHLRSRTTRETRITEHQKIY